MVVYGASAGFIQDIVSDRILHKYEKKLIRIIWTHKRNNDYSLTTDIIIYEKRRIEEEFERRENISFM